MSAFWFFWGFVERYGDETSSAEAKPEWGSILISDDLLLFS